MEDYDNVWCENYAAANCKYKQNNSFEQAYLDVISENSAAFEDIWTTLSQSKLEKHKFCDEFENQYIRVHGHHLYSLEDIWDHYCRDSVIDNYAKNRWFEAEIANVEIESAFQYNYKAKILPQYKTCPAVEDAYLSLIPEDMRPVNRKSSCTTTKQKVSNSKLKKSCQLKNLLESRLKRLKMMSDHIESVKTDENRIIYKCKLCNFECLKKRKLYVGHVIPVHISKTKSKKPRRKNKKKVAVTSIVRRTFYCSDMFCNKKFLRRSSRKRHMLVVHRRQHMIKCDFCEKQCRDKYDLSRHKLLKHKVTSRYLKCILCKYRTNRPSNLQRHCDRVHYGETWASDTRCGIACKVCKQTFLSCTISPEETHGDP